MGWTVVQWLADGAVLDTNESSNSPTPICIVSDLPDTRPPPRPETIDLRGTRRLGIIGDIHAEDEILEAAIKALTQRGAETLLCVGDIVDGDGDSSRCCQLLQEHNVFTVRGNHDRWFLSNAMRDLPDATSLDELDERQTGYVEELPLTRHFDTDAGKLLLCHGLGEDDMGSVGLDDEGYALDSNISLHALLLQKHAIVVCGHTHEAGARTFGESLLVNAGALKRVHDPCCILLDVTSQETEIISLRGVTPPIS